MAKFFVHSRHETRIPCPFKMHDGEIIEGLVPVVIVELVPADAWKKTITLVKRNISDDEKKDNAIYTAGAWLEAAFTPTDAPPAEEEPEKKP